MTTGKPIPLCVDLDGTLIRSDLLIESALALFSRNPLNLFRFLIWLAQGGRAHLKHQIALRSPLQVETLPFNAEFIDWLKTEHEVRPLVLCTASDRIQAEAVAVHLGLFSDVMASNGKFNLKGSNKAAALNAQYGAGKFDYAGDASIDLQVWKHARGAVLVGVPDAVRRAAERTCVVKRVFPRVKGTWKAWIKAMRLHQWLKNLLIFVPLLAAHRLLDPTAVLHSGIAFLTFSLCASGVYLLNDLLDLNADRRHPHKRMRPFASGRLPLVMGLFAAFLLTCAAFAVAFLTIPKFALILLGYYILTISYSLFLKRIVMLDVVILAALYTTRIIAGTVAIDLELSFWLLAFSMFIFLSLAMLKRYTELLTMQESGYNRPSGRSYQVDDLSLIQSLGSASGYLSVLILALYINSPASQALYTHPQVLWLLMPLLLYWISRAWMVAHRGTMHDDPVIFAVKDRTSRLVIVLGAIIVIGAL